MAEDDMAASPPDQPAQDSAAQPSEVAGAFATTDLALSGLVGARLCHDLVGPVGAITNGLDLMAETAASGTPAEEDFALVTQSTTRAADLLRALRLAFGQTTSGAPPIPRQRLLDDLSRVAATRRVHLAALGGEGPPLSGDIAQVGALLILCGRLVVGIAGTMEIVFSQDSDLPLRLTIEGPKAALSEEMRCWLAADPAQLPSSREVEMALLPRVAAAAGATVAHEDDGQGRVVLTVRSLQASSP